MQNPILNICLTFYYQAKFSKVIVTFYISTSNMWGFQFLYILNNMFYCIINIIVGMNWYLLGILTCIFQKTNGVDEHLCMFFFPICISSWGKCLLMSIFNWVICTLSILFLFFTKIDPLQFCGKIETYKY